MGRPRHQRRSLTYLKGRVQLDTRDMQVSMGAQAFELGPYRALLPASMPPGDDTIIHDTNLNLVYSHENRDARMEGRFAIQGFTLHDTRIAPDPMKDMSIALTARAGGWSFSPRQGDSGRARDGGFL